MREAGTWRRRVGVVLLLAVVPLAGSSGGEPVFTTLSVQPLVRPRAVLGADDRQHLAYELLLVNQTSLLAQVDALAALDEATGAVLAEWKGEALAAILRVNGGEPGTTLARGHSAYAFLDVAVPARERVPGAIRHRLSVTNLASPPGADEHKGVPIDPSLPIARTVTFETAPLPAIAAPALTLSPPLRGAGWAALNGCCAEVTSHRGAVMAFDGRAGIAERFAIDFVRVDAGGRLFDGPADRVESYAGFGAPVHAAAAGLVVEARDGMAEETPGRRSRLPLEGYAGNHVVIDLGGGHFALYAHLKQGSVTVGRGARVAARDVLGRVGNTGNSDAPHLHFQVMDGPAPLASNGLPYTLDLFDGAGAISPDEGFFAHGSPARIDRDHLAGRRERALPLNNQVVDFSP